MTIEKKGKEFLYRKGGFCCAGYRPWRALGTSRFGVARVAYLSCNPTTLIRDIEKLVRGGYELRLIELFDMFPQTAQVETLVILQRRHLASSGKRARRGR